MRHLSLLCAVAALSTTAASLQAAGPAAGPDRGPTSSFVGRVGGAVTMSLSGSAVFGVTDGDRQQAPVFSLSLGAYGERGSVVFSHEVGSRPAVGSYAVSEFGAPGSRDDFHALVVLGSAEQPVGVFRAQRGRVVIRRSSAGQLTGEYEIHAVGFLAADPDSEDRTITVRGSFVAQPSEPRPSFSASVRGAVQLAVSGEAEFGQILGDSSPRFSISLGARGDSTAVLFTLPGARPEVGVYQIGGGRPGAVSALVATGSMSQPSGVFHGVSGTLTVSRSESDRISGSFQIAAEGFLAEGRAADNRQVWVTGSFVARPSSTSTPVTLR